MGLDYAVMEMMFAVTESGMEMEIERAGLGWGWE